MVWQLIGEILDLGVDCIIVRMYLHRFLIDLIWLGQASAPLATTTASLECVGSGRAWSRQRLLRRCERLRWRTDDSLGVFGSRGAQAEFPQLLLGLVAERVQSGLGGLHVASLAGEGHRKQCQTCHGEGTMGDKVLEVFREDSKCIRLKGEWRVNGAEEIPEGAGHGSETSCLTLRPAFALLNLHLYAASYSVRSL